MVLAAALLVACAPGEDAPRAHRASPQGPAPVEVLGEQVTKPEPAPIASTSMTSAPAVGTTATSTPTTAGRDTVPRSTTSCADALAYLAAHQAPGFTDTCADGTALGHLGLTCVNQPGMCAGQRIIHIACPAPFVYMNEAHNSWTLLGQGTGIDPYGQGSDAERAACASHR